MENKKPDEQNTTSAETVSASPSADPQPVDAQLIGQQNEQIAELKALIGNLGERLTAVHAVNARDAEFRAAVRSVETAAAAVQRGLAPSGVVESALPGITPGRDCGCGPSCDGIPAGCCCFEVVLLRALVFEEQKLPEIADGAGPGQGNALELIFNVLADGEGECYPGLTSNLPIEKKQGWVAINKKIRKICIRCGEVRSVPLTVEVMEVEELALGGRPEFGANFGSLSLRCGCPTTPAIIEVHMTGGGVTEGKVWVEVGAKQI